jgi:hypothetical protein
MARYLPPVFHRVTQLATGHAPIFMMKSPPISLLSLRKGVFHGSSPGVPPLVLPRQREPASRPACRVTR